MNKYETKLQKDITTQADSHRGQQKIADDELTKQQQEQIRAEKEGKQLDEIDEDPDNEEEGEAERKPLGVV